MTSQHCGHFSLPQSFGLSSQKSDLICDVKESTLILTMLNACYLSPKVKPHPGKMIRLLNMTKNPAFFVSRQGEVVGIRLLAFSYVWTKTQTFKSWNPLLYPLETVGWKVAF